MGDVRGNHTPREDDAWGDQHDRSMFSSMHPQGSLSAPFQSQLAYLSQDHNPATGAAASSYGQQPFEMGALATALPQTVQPGMDMRAYRSSQDGPQHLAAQHHFPLHQNMFAQQQGSTFDPAYLARLQHQQYLGAQYGSAGSMHRPQQMAVPGQVAYPPIDPYGYGMSSSHFSPVDPRFAHHSSYVMGAMAGDMPQLQPRLVDTAPVPNYPRGPPRKPKQSGHALWVGNLPPAAAVIDLKDHFSRDATNEIESVFLIAKSNCAFVNYRSEAACAAAMNRFHDSRFHGVRLVCRLRRGTATTVTTPSDDRSQSAQLVPTSGDTNGTACGPDGGRPTTPRSQSPQDPPGSAAADPEQHARPSGEKVAEKYYIVKSLTPQDLEASVRNGVWATQAHNEKTLNRAYDQAENVYLIFSANKSGEYFGYARMASAISGEPVNLAPSPANEEPAPSADSDGSPQSIPTPATATAPKGRIIDDSARGTIFWEAERGDGENDATSPEVGASDNWGKQFKIEWLSTSKLPFYRTRGLRNPWNANREVKIARDGTELEPSVGKRLVQMFHHPQQPAQPTTMPPPGGLPYPR